MARNFRTQFFAVCTIGLVICCATGFALWRFDLFSTQAHAETLKPQRPHTPPKGERKPAGGAWKRRATVVSDSRTEQVTRQPAHIEPFEQTEVFAKAAGFVQVVHVDLGSRIKKDQPLAELWIPEMDQQRIQKAALIDEAIAAVGQAEAAVTGAQAEVAAAAAKVREVKSTLQRYEGELAFHQAEHARFKQLVERNVVEQKVLEEKSRQLASAGSALTAAMASVVSAEASQKVAEARVRQADANQLLAQAKLMVAKADLRATELLMEYAVIRAPYDGVVTERRIDTGDFAQSAANGKSEPLFTVMRADPLRIVVDVPESDASWIRMGQAASLRVDGIKDRVFAGSVKRCADSLDPKTRTLRVEIEISESTKGLRPGMYGMAEITAHPIDRSAQSSAPLNIALMETQERGG